MTTPYTIMFGKMAKSQQKYTRMYNLKILKISKKSKKFAF